MKKTFILMVFAGMALAMTSCGGSKKAAADYYNNPSPNAKVAPTLSKTKRETREVDLLAAKETTNMRAVGVGNDIEEKYARREALRDAQTVLAGYLETTIINLVTEYHKNANVNAKKFSETNIEEGVELAVAQKVSTKLIGVPEIYDVSDGTVSVYVCVELTKPTDEVIGGVYDQLSKDGVLGTDYDKQKFINDNKERLQELRDRVK